MTPNWPEMEAGPEPPKPELLRLDTKDYREIAWWLSCSSLHQDAALLAEILVELRQLTLVVAEIREFLRPGDEEPDEAR